MQVLALAIVVAAGLWLLGVAALMSLRPQGCLRLLDRMSANLRASDWRLHYTEQGLRVVVGVALIVRATGSKFPLAFGIAGWLLVATSALIMIAPVRWHGHYGGWWAKQLNPMMIRALSPVPVLLGAGVIYAAL